MALNGPKVAARWVDERRRTWWPPLKWWHFTTHLCLHTLSHTHTHLQYLSHPLWCTALRWRERTKLEQEVSWGAAVECGRGREQTLRESLDRKWSWVDEHEWELEEEEEVVSIGFVFEHFTVIWSNVPWTDARLLGRWFACACVWNVIWNADERWHDAKMTASHKPMPRLIHLCVCWVWQRREEDVTVTGVSITDGTGVCFMKANSVLLFFSSLYSSIFLISSSSLSSHLRADEQYGET